MLRYAFDGLAERVVGATASILAPRVVRGCGGCNRRGVDGADIVIPFLRIRNPVFRNIRWSLGDGLIRWRGQVCVRLVEVVEFSLLDLFPDNVDIQREIDFLERLDAKPWQQTCDDRQKQYSPEDQSTVDLGTALVELSTARKGCVQTGPEPYEQRADYNDKADEPVPTVSVEQDVEIGCAYRNGRNDYAHAFQFSDVESVFGNESAWGEDHVDEEEGDG